MHSSNRFVHALPLFRTTKSNVSDAHYLKKIVRLSFAASFLVLIASCTTFVTKNVSYSGVGGATPIKPPPLAWQISAKLGISSPQKNGSVTLNWQQIGEAFVIKVQGPLGQGNAIISGSQHNAEIRQPGRTTLRSDNVDELVFDTFGWTLPFDNFMHWVVATANPEFIIKNISFDPALGTLNGFQQSGWTLKYDRYKLVDNWVLPGRIKVTRLPSNANQQTHSSNRADTKQTDLTLIIREWTIL